MQILSTDVAIIGGGAAGCYAALDLRKRGIKPLIICKGLVGKSGASLFAGNLVISGRALGNSEANARNTAEFLIKYHNQFLIDQEWARRCGAWIEQVYYPELEELGLYFRRDDDGNVVTSPGAIRSIAANVQGNSGVPFMDLRRKQILRAGIPKLEETVATALLRNADGAIGGVFCLNYMTGEYIAVQARAVVLATGYSDRLHQRSTGTREMSADGIAMAWRAGATLVNMEMQWWHTNDIADPPCWQRMQVYPNPMLGSEKSARMVNSLGEEFFNQQQDDPLAFGPYTVQLKALAKQVHAGKARYDGGYYAGFDHCDAAEVDNYTTYGKAYRQLGLQFPQQLVETAVTSHYRQGGVDVDTASMRSSVPGLYVAGGVGGHSNGLIGLATYDGKVVADGIAGDFDSLSSGPFSATELDAERRRLERLRNSSGRRITPIKLKEMLRGIMWNKVGVEKDAAGLQSAIEDIEQIRLDLLPDMAIANRTPTANFEWLDAIDVVNMVDACELIARSSLQRKESRGPFFRRDFPATDNINWLVANVVSKSGNGLRFDQRPYALPFFRPDFDTKDNLEVAW
ncbi:MAG TPA: FAD-binding protein [Pseudolabrys sp.]|jgi:succinate dehydrogenase flavoprotein subunit|nr:FAD-binding protein [Pseudolabrys sp.]